MSIYVVDYFKYELERQISRQKPPMVYSAIETVDAAMWLITGAKFAQSLSSLCTCIELLLKGELQKFDTALIDNNNRLNATQVKELLSRGKKSDQKFVDFPEYTINAKEALKRVGYIDEYKDLISTWKCKLIELFDTRNKIIHSGTVHNELGAYTNSISLIAIPFIDTFLQAANNISLENLLTAGVYRELEVARNVCLHLHKETLQCQPYVLVSTGFKVAETFKNKPKSESDRAYHHRMEEDVIRHNEVEREISLEWADGDWVVEYCQICDSAQTYIKVKPYLIPERGLLPVAVRCPLCGLEINEEDKFLAMYHVKIRDEVLSDFFKDNFHEEYYGNLDYAQLLVGIKNSTETKDQ